MDALPSEPSQSNRAFYAVNAVVCAAALGLLFWILEVRHGSGAAAVNLRFMPAVNAGFNALASTFLVIGYRAIRRRDIARHRASMLAAFGCSALFLVGYVAYHYVHGDTKFAGAGAVRAVYLIILASHIVLSAIALPIVLTTFWFALKGNFRVHPKVARITLPIWLYVSVTGVVVFLMLRLSGSMPAVH